MVKQGQQSNDAPSVLRFIIVLIFVFFHLHFLLLFCFLSVVKLNCFLFLEIRVFPISEMDLKMVGQMDGQTDRQTDRPTYRDAKTHIEIIDTYLDYTMYITYAC